MNKGDILLFKLLSSWSQWEKYESFYLNELLPSIKNNFGKASDSERIILNSIKEFYNDKEWERLELKAKKIWEEKISQDEIFEYIIELINELNFEWADDYYKFLRDYYKISMSPAEFIQFKNKVIEDKIIRLFKKQKFIEADNLFLKNNNIFPNKEYEYIKAEYVRKYFNKIFSEDEQMDEEQSLAIADISKNLLLKARAGSGKTTTLASKIEYLIKHENIEPNHIVALCFNVSAAKEIVNRLNRKFGIEYKEKENITTFHSLASQIDGASHDILYNDKNPFVIKNLTNFISEVIRTNYNNPISDLDSEEAYEKGSIFSFLKNLVNRIKKFTIGLLLYSLEREYVSLTQKHLEEKGIKFGTPEYYLYIRNKSHVTLGGESVKSNGEKYIADFLFEHNISYKYESSFLMNQKPYYPDFFLKNNNIIIEHWGIDEKDAKMEVPEHWSCTWHEYLDKMNVKRSFWGKPYKGINYNLLETSVVDLKNGRESFEQTLKSRLESNGIKCEKLSLEQVLDKLKENLISKYSKKIETYIQKAKQNKYSPEDMDKLIKESDYWCFSSTRMFLNLANFVYKKYESYKKSEDKIDFYDLLMFSHNKIDEQKGDVEIRSGVKINEIKYLLIDEFQDFSPLFLELVKVIIKYNPDVKLFCVGDDWQSINSFMGADVNIFNDFENIFGENSFTKMLRTNYRSYENIVNTGNAIMQGEGDLSLVSEKNKGKIGVNRLIDINKKSWDIKVDSVNMKKTQHQNSAIKYRYFREVVEIINQYLDDLAGNIGKKTNHFKIYILDRTNTVKSNTLEEFLDDIKNWIINNNSQYSRKIFDYINISAAHSSKGLEADVVIILEANNAQFPLIHPDSELFEIFGDNAEKLIAEEKRLFYVACTRAKSNLYILYEQDFEKKKHLTEFYTGTTVNSSLVSDSGQSKNEIELEDIPF
ncbi:MAG: AAA family ATPase [Candidatus Buchananbacteria bacterium]|nr:AAA family ATPase [Candidatus Buchananbacteria bacterium]